MDWRLVDWLLIAFVLPVVLVVWAASLSFVVSVVRDLWKPRPQG